MAAIVFASIILCFLFLGLYNHYWDLNFKFNQAQRFRDAQIADQQRAVEIDHLFASARAEADRRNGQVVRVYCRPNFSTFPEPSEQPYDHLLIVKVTVGQSPWPIEEWRLPPAYRGLFVLLDAGDLLKIVYRADRQFPLLVQEAGLRWQSIAPEEAASRCDTWIGYVDFERA